MAKNQPKKQATVKTSNASYSILVPDYGLLDAANKDKIQQSNADHIIVLHGYNGDVDFNGLLDFSKANETEIIEQINGLKSDNILHWGHLKESSNGVNVAKQQANHFVFIGDKEAKSKNQKGKLGRIFYELSTQLSTKIDAYGSHTETAVYTKEVFIELLKNEGKETFKQFRTLASRAAQSGIPLQSTGNFDNISVQNLFKIGISNKLLFFKEKWNYFVQKPLADLKNKSAVKGSNNSIYRLLLFSVFLFSLIVLPILSFNYGATWDEKLHSDYGREVINEFPDGWFDNTIYEKPIHAIDGMKSYSASFDVVVAFIHKYIPSAGLYELRHFFNTFFGVFLFLFCALIAKEFGGWRTAFITFLLILFSPSLFGQIFNNPKDIPFATGFAMGVLYLIRYFKELPYTSLKTQTYLMLSIALAISIRPPGFILIAFFAMVVFVHWVLYLKTPEKKKYFIKYAFQFAAISVISYLLGILLWPFGLQDPINNPIAALTELSNFGQLTAYQIFEGSRQYIKPWYYIPKYLLITTPLIVLIGFPLGLFSFFKLKGGKTKLLLSFVLFVALFPVVYGISKDSYLYNGWRHFLFIYAPLLVFAGLGFEMILRMLKGKVGHYVVYGLLILGLGKVLVWQVQNHPYEYLYFNEIVGGVKGAAGDYETDYWCQTPKEAIEWLAKNEVKGDKKVRVKTNNETNSLQYYANKFSDSIQIVWSREYEWQKGQWDYAIWTSRTLSKNQIEDKNIWPPKGTIHTIDVEGFPMAAIVKRENNSAQKGIEALEQQNISLALEELKKAYEYDPYDEEVVRRIGMAYKAMNNYPEALKYLDMARELRDENYEALEAIGEIKVFQSEQARQQGDVQKANKLKEEAKSFFIYTLKYKTNFSTANYYLGTIYLADANYLEAIENFDKLLARNPQVPQGHIMKARAQMSLNSNKDAEQTLLFAINQMGLKNQELFLLLSEVYKRQGNTQAAQQVLSQMPK